MGGEKDYQEYQEYKESKIGMSNPRRRQQEFPELQEEDMVGLLQEIEDDDPIEDYIDELYDNPPTKFCEGFLLFVLAGCWILLLLGVLMFPILCASWFIYAFI
jgi:hypothetical protein